MPAIATSGGPLYVVPGEVAGESTISLTAATGVVCLRAGYCTNVAGVTMAAYGSATPTGTTSAFNATFGGTIGTWHFGALLRSIEGVGTVKVFKADAAHGFHIDAPPTTFSLTESSSELPAVKSYRALGFPAFKNGKGRPCTRFA
ncbi:MAG: hypothetical protein ABSG96_06020 [Terracidiphilus sp.]